MTKQEKKERIEYLTGYEANTAKDRLISIMHDLEEIGAVRKANSLGTIIGNLERWQHTR